MASPSNKVTIEHKGKKYTARYTVENKSVTVSFINKDGAFVRNSAHIGGSSAEAVARMLLREIVIR